MKKNTAVSFSVRTSSFLLTITLHYPFSMATEHFIISFSELLDLEQGALLSRACLGTKHTVVRLKAEGEESLSP